MIHKKIIQILQKIEAIGKNQKNTQGSGYNYRGIDDMYNELHSLFSDVGVFISSEVMSKTREERTSKSGGCLIYTILDVKFTFFCEDGSSVSSIMTGEAMDSGDKGCNKAMSTALKYALMQMFLIPTKDLTETNTERQTHEVAPKKTTKPEPLSDKKTLTKEMIETDLFKERYKKNGLAVAKENYTVSEAIESLITSPDFNTNVLPDFLN